MGEFILPIESIDERDVDLILLEELCTDNVLCEWFIRQINLPNLTSSNGARRSISYFSLGETDILFSYNSYNENLRLGATRIYYSSQLPAGKTSRLVQIFGLIFSNEKTDNYG